MSPTKKTSPKTSAPKQVDDAKKVEPNTLIGANTTFTITIPWNEVATARQQAILRAQQNFKMDGFRQGKVPLALVEKNIDRAYLINHTLDLVLPQYYREALEKNTYIPLTEPEVQPQAMEEGADWTFQVSIATRPEIVLGKYQEVVKKVKFPEITAEKDQPEPSEAQVRQAKIGAILEAVLQTVAVSVPELLLRKETEHQLRQFAEQLEQLKISVESYLEQTKKTVEQLQQEFAARALANLQVELFLSEVIRVEKLTATEEEAEAWLAAQHGHDANDHAHEHTAEQKQYAQSVLLKQQALDFLLQLHA